MIPPALKDLVSWAIPPLIGAVIGFVTNAIAIRMLFRPLKEIRIFGVRLPLTPGIFPRERRVLAQSIGRMVSRELITEDAMRRQIRSARTGDQLKAGVSTLSAEILATPLSGLSRAASSLFSLSIEEALRGMTRDFLTSRAAIHAVRDIVSRAVLSLSGSKAKEAAKRLGLRSLISKGLLPRLAEEKTRKSIAASAGRVAVEGAAGMVSERFLAAAARLLSSFADPATDRLMKWLRTPAMRRELAGRGRVLLSGILEKLNLLQRLIVSAGQFDRKLDEKMPEIVEDTLRALENAVRDPENRSRLLSAAEDALRQWGEGLSGGDAVSAGHLASLVESIVDGALERLGGEEERERAAASVESAVLGDGDPTLGSLARRYLGVEEDAVIEKISFAILEYLSRKETADLVSGQLIGFMEGFIKENADTPLGTILRVDKDRKEELDSFLATRLIGLIDARMPEILSGLDVEELVVQKIDGLDVRDVERLILEVLSTHLRWINVFGAILGFVIGLVQVGLRIFHVS